MALSLDNKYIVTASEDRSVKVLDLEMKKEFNHFEDIHEGMQWM